VTPSFWLLPLETLTAQGKSVSIATGNNALSAIDTGTTLIGGPSEDVANFWSNVPGSQALENDLEGFFGFPCSTTLTTTVSFGSNVWSISNDDMNAGSDPDDETGTLCVGAIFSIDLDETGGSGGGDGFGGQRRGRSGVNRRQSGQVSNPEWVFGDTFLKNVYSVFRSNPPAVGFASLADGSSGATSSSAVTATFSSTVTGSTVRTTTNTAADSSSPTTGSPRTATIPGVSVSSTLAAGSSVGTNGPSSSSAGSALTSSGTNTLAFALLSSVGAYLF